MYVDVSVDVLVEATGTHKRSFQAGMDLFGTSDKFLAWSSTPSVIWREPRPSMGYEMYSDILHVISR